MQRIAVIAGDGVGPEVVAVGKRVVDAAAGPGVLAWDDLDWGSAWYREHGEMMPADGIDQLRSYDAIYLGAVGSPEVPDHVTLWGLLLPIRQVFRPVCQPPAGAPAARCDLAVGRPHQ